jgi:hypothetical protein
MRDHASDIDTATITGREGPLPQQFIATALLGAFRGKWIGRAALATRIALTLAVAFVLVAALWVKAFG